jgi:hypothetical protein
VLILLIIFLVRGGLWNNFGRSRAHSFASIFLSLVLSRFSTAYAVLAHEAIIDSVWDTNIRPLLLKRCEGREQGWKSGMGVNTQFQS